MNIDEFLIILFSNIPLYILALALSMLLLTPLVKQYTKGVIDPLFYTLFMSGLANAIPFFLLFTNKIPIEKFIFFILAESFFWIGFSINARKLIGFKDIELVNNDRKNLILFYIFLIIYIALKLTAYSLLGIPVFHEEGRLSVFTNTGLGALERFSTFPVFFCSVYVYHLFCGENKHKILGYFTISIIVLFSILSGSKGSVLILVTGYFIYSYFYQKKIITFKEIKKYIPLLLIVPITVIALQSTENSSNPIESLLIRFIANGDCYYMAFPNDYVDFIQISNKFTYFFNGILSSFRLIDVSKVDVNIGLQLGWSINDIIDGSVFGPNTRPPILGWVFFRWGGVLLTFLIGLFASFLIYKPATLLPKGLLTSIFIGYTYYNLMTFVGDPTLAIGVVFDIIINTFLFLFFYILVYKGRVVYWN